LMPDGGVSPCVIRVLGIGGGGCNAVSTQAERSARRGGGPIRSPNHSLSFPKG
jgi:hypothetical protein